MSEELKPCPFCGGEAVKNSCAVAECKSCRSPVGCRACSIWKDSIDEWNTRVDDDENLSQYLGDLTAKLKLAVEALERLGDCDWVITLPDRMDAVRAIARDALAKIGEQRGRNGHKMHCSKGEGSVTDCHICSPIGEQR